MGIVVTLALLISTLVGVTVLLMVVTALLINERIQKYNLLEKYKKLRKKLGARND